MINLGLRMVLFSQNNVSKCHLPYSPVYTVTYNPCRVTSMSFPLVSVFSGRQLGEYLLNQVTSTKILVAMAQKVVAAWRVAVLGPLTWLSVTSYSIPRWDTPQNTH